jgi:hypothetical protein
VGCRCRPRRGQPRASLATATASDAGSLRGGTDHLR